MEYTIPISLVVGAAIGGYFVYLHHRISSLESIVWNFPSPEDLAKEVIKVKLPMIELPPDMVNKLKGMHAQSVMPPPGFGLPENMPPADDDKKIRDYTG